MVQSENTWKCQKKCFVFHLFTVSFTSMRCSLSHPLLSGCFNASLSIGHSLATLLHFKQQQIELARVCAYFRRKNDQCRKMFWNATIIFLWKFKQFKDAIFASINQRKSFNFPLLELTLLSNRPKSISMRFSSYMKLTAEQSIHFELSKKNLANSWRDYSFMLYAYSHTYVRTQTCTHACMCIKFISGEYALYHILMLSLYIFYFSVWCKHFYCLCVCE